MRSRPAATDRYPLAADADRIRVGVSACLLGQAVRFDGGHKRDPFLVDTLSRLVELVPVCPEVELGLGVPRETLRLERGARGIHLIASDTRTDHTAAMRQYARGRVAALARENLSGYVLKMNSPSCGMVGVPLHDARGQAAHRGRGLFAAALRRRFPLLPVEEEGRLHDARIRENFIERIVAYHRLAGFFGARWTPDDLLGFHARYQLELLVHLPRIYRELERKVAAGRGADRATLRAAYENAFMSALAKIPTVARHVAVLHQVAAEVGAHLDSAARRDLAVVIENYQRGRVPRIRPITLLRNYVRRFDLANLRNQVYLDPAAPELTL
jgi:uncharacterized protein YbbK (DUF523 family)/uncharacterized protein YbgA (DUF1722 family)